MKKILYLISFLLVISCSKDKGEIEEIVDEAGSDSLVVDIDEHIEIGLNVEEILKSGGKISQYNLVLNVLLAGISVWLFFLFLVFHTLFHNYNKPLHNWVLYL